jgi:peptidoglycan lytic transglycosylase G
MEQKRITPRSPRAALEPEHVPMPARPSRRARHPLVIAGNAVITLLLLVAIVVGVGFALAKQRFEAPGPLAQDKIVNIPKAHGIREIADLLQREGVIDQPLVFVGVALVLKARGEELKFGEYQFARQATLRDVVDIIVEGKVVQHLLTIPEGLTSEQIVQRLLEVEALSGNIKEIPREGTLLPEGYRFTRGMPREQLIQRMQEAQRRVLREIWDRRMQDLPVRTPEQLAVLASIIEKETGRPEERTRVASVFVNRLKHRMKLQSDPTIVYGLVGGRGTLGRPITRGDIEQPTPYNTYVIDGLPPGPIANPGRASLDAAANPARTKELFFVADGTGGHAFAENYDAHQRNVARLRVIEKEQKDTAPAELQTLPPTQSAAPAAGRPAQPAQQQQQQRPPRQGAASPRASGPQGRQQ